MTLYRIDKFCTPGTQIKSPGGLTFDLSQIAALEPTGGRDGKLVIRWHAGDATVITFHSNVDGGPPDIYGMSESIERAINGKCICKKDFTGEYGYGTTGYCPIHAPEAK